MIQLTRFKIQNIAKSILLDRVSGKRKASIKRAHYLSPCPHHEGMSWKTTQIRVFIFSDYQILSIENFLLKSGETLKPKWHLISKNGKLKWTVSWEDEHFFSFILDEVLAINSKRNQLKIKGIKVNSSKQLMTSSMFQEYEN